MATRTYDRSDERAGRVAYNAEHWLAWLMALGALVMGSIGLLVGFGIIGDDVSTLEAGAVAGVDLVNWQEGVLWLLPAVAIGLLGLALHGTEHHARSSAMAASDSNRSLFTAEHGLAYLAGLGTIAAAALCLLVGFDVFNSDNTFEDGVLWGMAGIVIGVVTVTLHTVGHHQTETDESVIVRIIEERTGTISTGPGATRSPAPEGGETRS